MSARVEEKHRAPIRWMHWINFPLLAMMMWSGLLIYWANPVYSLRLFGREIF
ncbi:MAG: thiosulfate reductase, partial [Acidobacteria bacterium]|nr:thiosulfate reductase [Acidobacteriota bacterium]